VSSFAESGMVLNNNSGSCCDLRQPQHHTMPILSTSKVIGYLYLTLYKSNINYPLIDYWCPTGYKCGLQFPTRLAVSPVIKFVSFTKIKSAKDVLL